MKRAPRRPKLTHMQGRAAYEEGQAARRAQQTIGDCPHSFSDLQRRSWFLAGWHDADMEQAGRKLKSGYR